MCSHGGEQHVTVTIKHGSQQSRKALPCPSDLWQACVSHEYAMARACTCTTLASMSSLSSLNWAFLDVTVRVKESWSEQTIISGFAKTPLHRSILNLWVTVLSSGISNESPPRACAKRLRRKRKPYLVVFTTEEAPLSPDLVNFLGLLSHLATGLD